MGAPRVRRFDVNCHFRCYSSLSFVDVAFSQSMTMETSAIGFDWNTSESPFSSVLHTNHVPSPSELAKMDTFLAEPQQKLSKLESEILQLQKCLAKLSSERDRARTYITAHRALMSAICRLPAETLAEIFVHCIPTDRYPVRNSKEAPLLLTNICRSWRAIAISAPHLWSALHVCFPKTMTPEAVAHRGSGVQLWLERSRPFPLNISLAIKKYGWWPANDKVQDISLLLTPLFQNLMEHGHRFAEVALLLDTDVFHLLDTFSPAQFPVLRSFALKHTHDHLTPIANSIITDYNITWFQKMPQLKKLNLNGFQFDTINELLALDCRWSSLTEIILHFSHQCNPYIGLVELAALLEHTPQLQLCRASVMVTEDFQFPQSYHPIQLGCLHTMILVIYGPGGWVGDDVLDEERFGQEFSRAICTLTHFPSLQTLHIIHEGRNVKMKNIPFPSPLQNLSWFRLEISLSPAGLAELLASVPNLKVLEMVDVGYDFEPVNRTVMPILQDFHLAGLSGAADDRFAGVLCPHLTTFRFRYPRSHTHPPLSTDVFLDFLERKRWPETSSQTRISRLEVCDLILSTPRDRMTSKAFMEESLKRWRKLHQDGLKLTVNHQPYIKKYSDEFDEPEEDLPDNAWTSLEWPNRFWEGDEIQYLDLEKPTHG